MVQSNEFTGRTLTEAVRKATAAYDHKRRRSDEDERERERTRRCDQLEREFDAFQRDVRDALRRAESLQREVDSLRRAARRSARDAVIAALVAASGSLGSLIRILRTLARLRFKDLSRRDFVRALPFIGGAAAAAAAALNAIEDFEEAERLAERARREILTADRLTEQILRIESAYSQAGCGRRRRPGLS